MGISQIIMLVLLGINLLLGANEHGKEKTGKKLADFIKRFYPMVYPSPNEIEYVTPAI
jgi:hypothetical protein